MGGPPLTAVKATFAPLNGAIARFALSSVRERARKLLDRPDVARILDEAWCSERFTGCALLLDESDVSPEALGTSWAGSARCTDPVIVLNVLGRARKGMLLASAPLILDPDHLEGAVHSDDPRLVALATRRSRQ
jgi:hypothetical protein